MDPQRGTAPSCRSSYHRLPAARPVSWHPNFSPEHEWYQPASQPDFQQAFCMAQNTNFSYGLITPNTSVLGEEQQFDCPEISLDQMANHEYGFVQPHEQFNMQTNTNEFRGAFSSYVSTPLSAFEQTDLGASNMMCPPFPSTNNFQFCVTAPTSPEVLPMLDLGQSFDTDQTEGDGNRDELVGMGLYDSPAQVQSTSLFGGSLPVRRKSLKLEESFEPVTQADTDEDDDDDDAESEPVEQEETYENKNDQDSRLLGDQVMIPEPAGKYSHDLELSGQVPLPLLYQLSLPTHALPDGIPIDTSMQYWL